MAAASTQEGCSNWNTFLCTSTTTVQQGLCHAGKPRRFAFKRCNGEGHGPFMDRGIRMVRCAPRQCMMHATMKKAAGLAALRLLFQMERYYIRSKIPAAPIPVPTHMVTMP